MMLDYDDFEDTTRFSDAELSSVMQDIRARLAAGDLEEDESEAATEMVSLSWNDIEPIDSETAAFSLEAPALKSLEAADRMPHTETPVVRNTWVRDISLAAASGTGLAFVMVGALWMWTL